MSKKPGRKPQPTPNKKRQLSSDAKIIVALLKEPLQTRNQLSKNAEVGERTLYRVTSFLKEIKIIKCIEDSYCLWNYDPIEKKIEDALNKFVAEHGYVVQSWIVDEVGQPWSEIEKLTFTVAKRLKLTYTGKNGKAGFTKFR